jgi:hypothetical protein
MAYKHTAICDRCKHEDEYEATRKLRQLGWTDVKISTEQRTSRDLASYLLCPKCCESLGIGDTEKPTADQERSLADRLMDCIDEMVSEAVQNNGN